jgi:hypothetical protein
MERKPTVELAIRNEPRTVHASAAAALTTAAVEDLSLSVVARWMSVLAILEPASSGNMELPWVYDLRIQKRIGTRDLQHDKS